MCMYVRFVCLHVCMFVCLWMYVACLCVCMVLYVHVCSFMFVACIWALNHSCKHSVCTDAPNAYLQTWSICIDQHLVCNVHRMHWSIFGSRSRLDKLLDYWQLCITTAIDVDLPDPFASIEQNNFRVISVCGPQSVLLVIDDRYDKNGWNANWLAWMVGPPHKPSDDKFPPPHPPHCISTVFQFVAVGIPKGPNWRLVGLQGTLYKPFNCH